MIYYNIKSALRNISRIRNHTLISVLGLTIGLTCVFVIAAWTLQELSFDKFHKNHETTYMVTTDIRGFGGDYNSFPETPPPLAERLEEQIPDIVTAAHFIYLYGGRSLTKEHNTFKERGIAVDLKFLDIFSFELLIGDMRSLDEPNTIFITKKLANKLFPHQEAIGKYITYKKDQELVIKGIIKDIPKTSSLQFEFLVPYQLEADNPDEWWQLSDATFIKTRSKAQMSHIKPLAEKLFREHISDDQYNINFVPIKDLRYGAKFPFFEAEHGNIRKLYTFILIAVLILVLACLNYINLNSSYASKRMNEVMVRKVNGASTRSLVGYFISESILISIISWGLAVMLSISTLNLFQQVLGVEIDMSYYYLSLTAGFFITIVLIGMIAGLYPAIITSSVMPFQKNLVSFKNLLSQQRLKNAFLLSQFVLSISLVIACLVIIKQNIFMSRFEVGYDKNNIIEVGLYNEKVAVSHAGWMELAQHSEIENISFAGASPVNLSPIFTAENWNWEGLSDKAPTSFYRINVDENYLKVFDIPLVKGRFFNGSESDLKSIVINNKLQKVLGFDEPIGKILIQGETEYSILGVTKDFHFQHLSNEIQPLVFFYSNQKNRMFARTNGESQAALALIRDHHKKVSDTPLFYHYISDSYEEMYAPEHKISKGIIAFTVITIILSSIGLLGMIIFSTEMKTKEIAVRKVHGAKIANITFILNRGMLLWFSIAFVLSSVLSWFTMNSWLENFAFRINLDWWIFLSGALIILVLTILTVSFQTWKAAIKNPVDALKYE